MKYAVMHRLGLRPWERYASAAHASIAALLDREEEGRSRPLGRALDLGCGRDVGCFQGLGARGRTGEGRTVSALAEPGATLLMLAFGPSRLRALVEGVSRDEVEEAFVGWTMLSVDPAETRGLGWPMSTTSPQWYRMRRAP